MREDYRPSRGRNFLLHNRSSCAAEQFHSDTSLEAVNRRAPSNSKTGSGRRKVMSACDDRHLLCMAVNNHRASSKWQHVVLLLHVI
ncbi:hypothetical protein TNCV_1941 [Trichonephila clavipes]|nr:hypothetical protein TNCV_1941 [Trichonephila clavipes]